MLFTHFGLSGPLVLSASAHCKWEKDQYTARHRPQARPGRGPSWTARILRDIAQAPNKDVSQRAGGPAAPADGPRGLPERADIPPDLPVNALTKGQRRRLHARR